MAQENLLRLLQRLIDRIPWPTEQHRTEATDLLRGVEADAGHSGIVAPAADAPPPAQPVPEQPEAPPVPDGWTPPQSPEVVGAPEETNAFAATEAPPERQPGY